MHIKREKILAYVAERLPDEETFEIDLHLAECKECAQRVKAHYLIREDFDDVLATCALPRFTEELPSFRVKEALRKATLIVSQDTFPSVKERVRNWLGRVSQKADLVFGFAIDATRKKAEIVKEGLEAFCSSKAVSFEPVYGPPLALGERPTPLSVHAPSDPLRPRITVGPVTGRVSIQIEKIEKPWPLVFLFSTDEDKGYLTEFHSPEEADYLLAEFEGVVEGNYLLILEPNDYGKEGPGDHKDH